MQTQTQTSIARKHLPACMLWLGALAFGAPAQAQDTLAAADGTRGSPPSPAQGKNAEDTSEERWNIHAQTTYVYQYKEGFNAPYTGPQSLATTPEYSYTWTFTTYMGARLWKGGELYFDPEVVVGQPLSHLYGLASIQNGEIQKNGGTRPRGYYARWFLRQTFDLGGDAIHVEDGPNQLAGNYDSHRFVVTLGKITLTDIFEKNTYANDPRTQFLNWAMITYGAWDYAADARAYTIGGAGEFYWDNWVVRIGRFMEPKEANGTTLDHNIWRYHGDEIEVEHDHKIGDLPGLVRVLGFANRAYAGSYTDAIAAAAGTGEVPNLSNVLKTSSKVGYGISFEQRLSSDVGVFLRASSANDRVEEFAFTEIDNDLSGGVSVNGTRWNRPDDVFGIAFSTAGLNRQHREYLAAGGLGGFLGDGQLAHYGREEVLEAYYNYHLFKGVELSPDGQMIVNPGYNADRRGPVFIYGMRVHLEI
ncbi:carbohydrate porin [Dyella psychrodurans]|uniref:Carbohydrate porin n=1 Tax=Dyella psychrodurans TaxID=1927960 RepID=A0A370X746_9GAMM|nr:carbohydrate porin [Dyella psychrodurans]RDS84259.1 carbohydrate porin [Dyella psychrodurans]